MLVLNYTPKTFLPLETLVLILYLHGRRHWQPVSTIQRATALRQLAVLSLNGMALTMIIVREAEVRSLKELCHDLRTTVIRARSTVVRNTLAWKATRLIASFHRTNLLTSRVVADWDRPESRLAGAKDAKVGVLEEVGQVSEIGRIARVAEAVEVGFRGTGYLFLGDAVESFAREFLEAGRCLQVGDFFVLAFTCLVQAGGGDA